MKKDNKNIRCYVSKCKFNNIKNEFCELDEIKISCNCENDECDCKEKTICDSYKERK